VESGSRVLRERSSPDEESPARRKYAGGGKRKRKGSATVEVWNGIERGHNEAWGNNMPLQRERRGTGGKGRR